MMRNLTPTTLTLSILLWLLASALPAAAQNTYYISKSGSNSNTAVQAKSTSTPWASMPGMASCSGACATYTPVAGDTFCLKGGESWLSVDLPVSWDWSGTNGSHIRIDGTCAGWGTGRAILANASHTVFSRNAIFNGATSGATSYFDLANIEMTGLACTGACTSPANQIFFWCFNSCSNTSLSNLYFHAWNIVTDSGCQILGYGGSSVNNSVDSIVIDGSDATGASPAGGTCYAIYTTMPNVTNSVIHDLANGLVGSGTNVTIAGNHIYNIVASNAGSHPNAIETIATGTYFIYNNLIHDSAGETIFVGNLGETDFIFNDVIYNVLNNPPGIDTRNGAFTGYWFNNTVAPLTGNCFSQTGAGSTTQTLANNHCITTGVLTNGTTGFTTTTNLTRTPTQAAADCTGGANCYVSTSTYVYSPKNSGGNTIQVGTKQAALCTTIAGLNAAAGTACLSATTYGVGLNTLTHTVVIPGLTASIRGGTNWDVGAYEFTSASSATAALTASPLVIKSGTSAILASTCTNSASASIDGGVGSVSATTANTSVSPVVTTTYTLTCTPTVAGTPATATATVTLGGVKKTANTIQTANTVMQ